MPPSKPQRQKQRQVHYRIFRRAPFATAFAIAIPLLFQACSEPDAPTAFDSQATAELSGQLVGPRVIRYPSHRTITARIPVRGTRGQNGECHLARSVKLSKCESILETVIEYDPDTCRFIIARHPSDQLVIPADGGQTEGSDSLLFQPSGALSHDYGTSTIVDTIQQSGGSGGGGAVPFLQQQDPEACYEATGFVGTGILKVWHQDPIGLQVTSADHTNLFFYLPQEQCVQWSQSTLTTSWFLPTQWFPTGFPSYPRIDLTPLPSNNEWQWVQAVGRANFENRFFANMNPTCGISPDERTYTRYWNELRLFNDGDVTFSLGNTYTWGDCSELLQLGMYFTFY